MLKLTPAIEAMASADSGSGLGSGGMAAKLAAARIAGAAGIHLAIADGRVAHPLQRFAATGRGTVFVAGDGARAKKAWLAGRLTVARHAEHRCRCGRGAGARQEPAGGGGDRRWRAASRAAMSWRIAGPDGVIGRMAWPAMMPPMPPQIKGLRGEVQAAVLGYAPRAAIVHADHLVLL